MACLFVCTLTGMARYCSCPSGDVSGTHITLHHVIRFLSSQTGHPSPAAHCRPCAWPPVPVLQQTIFCFRHAHHIMARQKAASKIHNIYPLYLSHFLPHYFKCHGCCSSVVSSLAAALHTSSLLHRLSSAAKVLARGSWGICQHLFRYSVLPAVCTCICTSFEAWICKWQSW